MNTIDSRAMLAASVHLYAVLRNNYIKKNLIGFTKPEHFDLYCKVFNVNTYDVFWADASQTVNVVALDGRQNLVAYRTLHYLTNFSTSDFAVNSSQHPPELTDSVKQDCIRHLRQLANHLFNEQKDKLQLAPAEPDDGDMKPIHTCLISVPVPPPSMLDLPGVDGCVNVQVALKNRLESLTGEGIIADMIINAVRNG